MSNYEKNNGLTIFEKFIVLAAVTASSSAFAAAIISVWELWLREIVIG